MESDWRFGTTEEAAWITRATQPSLAITSAIPDVFAAYATVVLPEGDARKTSSDKALLAVLREHSPVQPWWLGYLETGASDVVFPKAPRIELYSGWPYVLVLAGPDEASAWRGSGGALPWHSGLPELMFPADRSWLVSTLWDDDWACVGASTEIVDALQRSTQLDVRVVAVDIDATPTGHTAI